jgi:hypothetical protein
METKAITIKLPSNHPVFDVPRGRRSETIRKWLDLGMNMSGVIEALEPKFDILNRIVELLEGKQLVADNPRGDGIAVNLDMDSFIDSISEVFHNEPEKGDDEKS